MYLESSEIENLYLFLQKHPKISAAPETLMNKSMDIRSDVYSVGVLLYLMSFQQDLSFFNSCRSDEEIKTIMDSVEIDH